MTQLCKMAVVQGRPALRLYAQAGAPIACTSTVIRRGSRHLCPSFLRLSVSRSPAHASLHRCSHVQPRAQGSDAASVGGGSPSWQGMELWATRLTSLFPVWVALGCYSGFTAPALYNSWFEPAYVTAMLSVTMLGMGFTLSMQDITDVLNSPMRVSIGTVLQVRSPLSSLRLIQNFAKS